MTLENYNNTVYNGEVMINKRMKQHGFKTTQQFNAWLDLEEMTHGEAWARHLLRVFTQYQRPHIRTSKRYTDHDRVKWARSAGMTKRDARRYMRHRVLPDG